MTAQVERDHAEIFRKRRIAELARPREMALVEAVDEQNFAAARIAEFMHGERQSVG